MTNKFIKFFLTAAVLTAACGTAVAEDIDIYSVNNGTGLPNLLFILDNHADFDAPADACNYIDVPAHDGIPAVTSQSGTDTLGTMAGMEQCALFNAIQGIPTDTMNIGIMMFNSNNMSTHVPSYGCPATADGGCLIYPLTQMTGANKTALLAFIKTWGLSSGQANSVKGSNELTASSMQEAWAYYKGAVGLSTRDYSGIRPASGCQRNFVAYVGNAWSTNGTPGDGGNASPKAALLSAPGVTTAETTDIAITYAQQAFCNTKNPFYTMPNHTDSSGLYADEWARYMFNHDLYTGSSDPVDIQNIITYTVGVLNVDKCKAEYPALLNSMATVGGGKYLPALNYADLLQAFSTIINEVQAVNSVFASASLPVSVNTQGTYLNQIYIGMFRPDAQDLPRWNGNLKQYKFRAQLNLSTNKVDLILADKNNDPAIASSGTGFISPSATSYWSVKTSSPPDTLGANGGFWINNQQGAGKGFDAPDGEVVEKGGASQQLRLANLFDVYADSAGGSTNPRRLFTCTGSCATNSSLSGTPFAPSNSDVSTTALGLTTTASSSVTTLNRSVTTPGSTASNAGTAKFVLSAAPTTPLTDGQSVVISGASDTQFNGTKTISLIDAVTFTIPVTEYPPLSSTTGYSASVPGVGSQAITSLTRSGTTATATAPGHTFLVGEKITITGATGTEYLSTTFTITSVTSSTFTFTVGTTTTTSLTSPATVSTSTTQFCKSGNKTFTFYSTSSLTLVANAGSSTGYYAVGVASNNYPCGSGDNVQIVGATPSTYSGTFSTVKTTTNCPGVTGASLPDKNNYFCYEITPPTTVTPASPDTGGAIVAIRAAATASITGITRPASTCNATTGISTAIPTATTSATHAFIAGESVTISGTAAANESAYLGTFTILTVPSSTTFTYSIPSTTTGIQTSPTPTSTPGCPFSTGAVSVATSVASIDRTTMINWIRGEDNLFDELSPDTTIPRTTINIRPSIHGDVLHSRPAIINYATGKIVALYGANDGVFHAVNANQTGNIGSVPPGGELWGFIPKEFFNKLSRQYLNSPIVKLFTTTPVTPAPEQKPYYFDGDVGVYQTANSDRVIIFMAARRGGRLVYAIDVTDPLDPKFLWKKGCPNLTNNTGCDNDSNGDFTELGQTWSAPKAAAVAGYSNPVVIFGGGYYGGYDSSTGTYFGQDADPPASTSTMGRGVFVLDAFDGHIVWKAGPGGSTDSCTGTALCSLSTMNYPVSADITVIDRNFDGKIDRGYAADTGGNIWRIDFPFAATSPSDWSITKFAAVGGASLDPVKRKFLYPPDVVFTSALDLVMAATGDREHPLALNTGTNAVINRFYMFKDPYNGVPPNLGTLPSTWSVLTDSTSSTANTAPSGFFDCTLCATGGTTYTVAGNNGYFVTLLNSSASATGEKGVNQPASIGGFTYFATNEPKSLTANTCRSLGTARGYRINTFSGAVAFTVFDTGGLPPSPVIGTVTVPVPGPGGTTVDTTLPFLIGGGNPDCNTADCHSSIGGGGPPLPPAGPRVRKFWYTEHDK